ncbi:armadillo-type protein [Hyaloraphidium curvatum]|nr:armadillo-type protein [Hyaloraphidium curvatum]
MLEPLIKMGAYGKLAELLAANADDAALSTTVAEALGTAAAGSAAGRKAIRESGAIITLVGLLSSTNAALLCNVAFVLGKCSQEPESCAIIDAKEGLRLLFSLLKQSSRRVQSAAALAVSELALHSPSAAETVRSFVGALELLVPLLRAPDTRLQAHACKAVASIARDPENLAVISDHGVVGSLSGLVDARDEYLRRELALAIEACCQFGTNRQQFGTNDVVAPLAKYLKSSDPDVQRAAARALFQLSSDGTSNHARKGRLSPCAADNSRALAATGVLPTLVELVGSECGETSRAAAGILANVRMQAPR